MKKLLLGVLMLTSCANQATIDAWRANLEGHKWTVRAVDVKQEGGFLGNGPSYTEIFVERDEGKRYRFRACNDSQRVLVVGDVIEFKLNEQQGMAALPLCWFDAVRP